MSKPRTYRPGCASAAPVHCVADEAAYLGALRAVAASGQCEIKAVPTQAVANPPALDKPSRCLLTPAEVADVLRLDALGIRSPRRSVLRMIRMGQLRGVAVSGRMLIDSRSLDQFIDANAR